MTARKPRCEITGVKFGSYELCQLHTLCHLSQTAFLFGPAVIIQSLLFKRILVRSVLKYLPRSVAKLSVPKQQYNTADCTMTILVQWCQIETSVLIPIMVKFTLVPKEIKRGVPCDSTWQING